MEDSTYLSSKKVLVVEDDPFLRDLYTEILAEINIHVDTAEDGEKGFELLHQGGYDLVLLDIMLPKIDGLSILKKLTFEPPTTPNRVILVLSNLGQESVIAEAINLGAQGYLIKSDMTPEKVVSEVKRYLS